MKKGKDWFKTDYGILALYYDSLDRLNFSNISRRSRDHFLDKLPFIPQNPIIVGCGTGDFAVSYVRKLNPPRLTVNDISEAMIRRTVFKLEKSGWKGQLSVIHQDITTVKPAELYDFISLNFILNLFSPRDREEFLRRIRGLLSPGGIIQAADFARPANPWLVPVYHLNWFLANVFFLFFSFTRPNRLGDMELQFAGAGLRVEAKKNFLGGLYASYLLRADDLARPNH